MEEATERHRLAAMIDHAAFEPGWWPEGPSLEWDAKCRRGLALDKADDILAAGFGDVAIAKADERAKVALMVTQDLLSEMVRNGAYEYNGKPIYDGLSREHIDATLAEYRPKAQQ